MSYHVLDGIGALRAGRSTLIPQLQLIRKILGHVAGPLNLGSVRALKTFHLKRRPFLRRTSIVGTRIVRDSCFGCLTVPELADRTPVIVALRSV